MVTKHNGQRPPTSSQMGGGEKWIQSSSQTKKWTEAMQSVQCHKADGFGAQYHCQMAALAKARHDGECFILHSFAKAGFHANSKNMDGNAYTGMKTDEKCDPNEKVHKCDTPYCAEGSKEEKIDQYYTKAVRDELRTMYWKTAKPAVDKSCEVAVHIREGDVWASRKIPFPVIIDALDKTFGDKKICIFSEGKESAFKELKSLKNVELKLNVPVDETFHSLVAAPNLVIAKSSFSYTAGVLNAGNVFFIQRFWHKMLADWKQIPKSSKAFSKMPEGQDLSPQTFTDLASPDFARSDFD